MFDLSRNAQPEKALAWANGTSWRAGGWADENAARSQEHPTRFLLGDEGLAN